MKRAKIVGILLIVAPALFVQTILGQTPGATKSEPRNTSPQNSNQQAANPLNPERHEFIVHDFKTESGVTLPEARVVYGTYGH